MFPGATLEASLGIIEYTFSFVLGHAPLCSGHTAVPVLKGSLLVGLRGPYVWKGVEPRHAACKAFTQPLDLNLAQGLVSQPALCCWNLLSRLDFSPSPSLKYLPWLPGKTSDTQFYFMRVPHLVVLSGYS